MASVNISGNISTLCGVGDISEDPCGELIAAAVSPFQLCTNFPFCRVQAKILLSQPGYEESVRERISAIEAVLAELTTQEGWSPAEQAERIYHVATGHTEVQVGKPLEAQQQTTNDPQIMKTLANLSTSNLLPLPPENYDAA